MSTKPVSPAASPTASPRGPVSPFPPLAPILSSFSQQHRIPPEDDGYDNFPAPLPHDAVELERRITSDPDVRRQMRLDDEDLGPPPEGGKEAWLCVFGAFFLLFCFFGFCEYCRSAGIQWSRAPRRLTRLVTSFGTLQEYYLENQLSDHTKSDVA